jgi:hypothetical protein
MSDDLIAARDEIGKGIEAALPGMVTAWVVVVETVDVEGDRHLYSFEPDGQTYWHTDALLANGGTEPEPDE